MYGSDYQGMQHWEIFLRLGSGLMVVPCSSVEHSDTWHRYAQTQSYVRACSSGGNTPEYLSTVRFFKQKAGLSKQVVYYK